MDIAEKVFGHFAILRKRRERSLRRSFEVALENQLPSARLLSQTNLPILPTQGVGGVSCDAIWLPERMSLFDDGELNRFILCHKAAVAGSLLRIFGSGLAGVTCGAISNELRREVEAELTLLHPCYREWVRDFMPRLHQAIAGLRKLSSEQKSALWVEILPSLNRLAEEEYRQNQEEARARRAEQERSAAGPVEVVDLNSREKEDNPVHHSFEKIETADDYTGGFRQTDGSDQLQDHGRALEDLKLNKVTRHGEAAQSLYAADTHSVSPERIDSAELRQGLVYPEWDYRRRNFREYHCHLSIGDAVKAEAGEGQAWIKRLEHTYRHELQTWRTRLEKVFNKPRWQDRQLDGPEFSIDAWISYCGDVRHRARGQPKIFMRQRQCVSDAAIFILFDQSYSTDSFVQGRRVLDVELDAIGLIGRLLSNPGFRVAVASTWSETRHNCRFEMFKDFAAEWTQFFGAAPCAKPCGYTRLGPAIRHATYHLSRQKARDKLLILLTDGRPTDCDSYEGHYGIEDVHHALLESAQSGVRVRALAVEQHARHYFPQLFGRGGYRILSKPAQLPSYLFEILVETLGKK